MNRRQFLKIAGTSVAVAITGCQQKLPGFGRQSERPNILLITTGQQRKDSLGIYNKNSRIQISTPNIDGIAADGIACDRAYIPHLHSQPMCSTNNN